MTAPMSPTMAFILKHLKKGWIIELRFGKAGPNHYGCYGPGIHQWIKMARVTFTSLKKRELIELVPDHHHPQTQRWQLKAEQPVDNLSTIE